MGVLSLFPLETLFCLLSGRHGGNRRRLNGKSEMAVGSGLIYCQHAKNSKGEFAPDRQKRRDIRTREKSNT